MMETSIHNKKRIVTMSTSIPSDYFYLGQCDKLRSKQGGEVLWAHMMNEKRCANMPDDNSPLFPGQLDFLPMALLDVGETWNDYLMNNQTRLYYSVWGVIPCVFIQLHGFEFVFLLVYAKG